MASGERLGPVGVRAVVLSGEGRASVRGWTSARSRRCGAGNRRSRPPLARAGRARQGHGQRAAYMWAELAVPVIAASTATRSAAGCRSRSAPTSGSWRPTCGCRFEVAWGLIPDMTGTQLLPELVGRDVAKELT